MVRVNVSDAFDYSRYSFKHNFVMTTNFNNCPIGGNTIIPCPVKFHSVCKLWNATCRNVSGHQIDLFIEINSFFFINVIYVVVIPGYEKLPWRNSQPLHLVVYDTLGS